MVDDCGLLNLATCIPQKIYDFIMGVINAPIQPLLTLTKNLLTSPVDLTGFGSAWAVVMYILSMFYGLLLLYVGFNFMISGYDLIKRERAKMWFRNIIIMIVLVQLSYFIYATFIDINSLMTSGIVNMTDSKFFLLSIDNLNNIGLELFFGLIYVAILLFTVIILALRYIFVAVGVIMIPIGIFLYFIPPLSSYGKAIINFLGVCIFITFFDALILLAGSKVLAFPTFQEYKILVMIACFLILDFLMFYFIIFALIKSAFSKGEQIAGNIMSVAKYFV